MEITVLESGLLAIPQIFPEVADGVILLDVESTLTMTLSVEAQLSILKRIKSILTDQ